MIEKVTYEKITKRLKEKKISRYSLVDAKRDTKEYDEYYKDDPFRFSNDPFDSINNSRTLSWDSIIKFMNTTGTDNIYDVITLWDENGKEVIPEALRKKDK